MDFLLELPFLPGRQGPGQKGERLIIILTCEKPPLQLGESSLVASHATDNGWFRNPAYSQVNCGSFGHPTSKNDIFEYVQKTAVAWVWFPCGCNSHLSMTQLAWCFGVHNPATWRHLTANVDIQKLDDFGHWVTFLFIKIMTTLKDPKLTTLFGMI